MNEKTNGGLSYGGEKIPDDLTVAMTRAALHSYDSAVSLLMSQGLSVSTIALLCKAMGAMTDVVTTIQLEHHAAQGRHSGCGTKCSTCCHQNVFMTPLEAFVMVAHVDPSDGDDLRRRSESTALRVSGMSGTQRWTEGISCPALKSRQCSVYAARPVICRSYHSFSRRSCLRAWENRGKRGRKDTVPDMTDASLLSFSVAIGINAALRNLHGLEMEEVELARGLAIALTPGSFDRWISGERVFGADTLSRRTRRGVSYETVLDGFMKVAQEEAA